MTPVELLRQQTALTELLASGVLANVKQEHVAWRLPDAATNTIGATIFHAYHTEDRIVQGLAQGKPRVFEDGWAARLGADPSSVWSATQVDADALRAYAGAVHGASKAYLARADGADWDREVELPVGRRTLGLALSLGLVVHKSLHVGEVAALLGSQGAKGLPF